MKTLALGLGLSSIVGVAVIASGCSNTVSVGKGGAGGQQATSTSAGNTVVNTSVGTNGTGNGTGSQATSGTTGGQTGTSTGSGVTCNMAPGDSVCTSCAKSKCCMQITACAADPACDTCFNCLQANQANPAACQMSCSFSDPPTQAVVQCAGQKCQSQCQGGGTTSSTGTNMAASTSSTGGATCMPAPNDKPCVSCAKMNCCSQYDACQANAQCACYAACIAAGKAATSCASDPMFMCGNASTTTQSQLFALGQCVGNNNCGCPTGMGGG